MEHLVLGKQTEYAEHYDASLLQRVPRTQGRNAIDAPTALPFTGVDIWNAFELSWLNNKGKPVVAIMQCNVPYNSEFLIESKSFKLYLNSFNQTRFESLLHVKQVIEKDLSHCAGETVEVIITPSNMFGQLKLGEFESEHQSFGKVHLLDELDISMDHYNIDANELFCDDLLVNETLVTHLLKSNCLITNQPDWGSLLIKYAGKQINKESLLKYIVSFRQHNEFHEQCVERIFMDIWRQCEPERLTVYARYTRRGGLDINPFRSNFETPYANVRLARQ